MAEWNGVVDETPWDALMEVLEKEEKAANKKRDEEYKLRNVQVQLDCLSLDAEHLALVHIRLQEETRLREMSWYYPSDYKFEIKKKLKKMMGPVKKDEPYHAQRKANRK